MVFDYFHTVEGSTSYESSMNGREVFREGFEKWEVVTNALRYTLFCGDHASVLKHKVPVLWRRISLSLILSLPPLTTREMQKWTGKLATWTNTKSSPNMFLSCKFQKKTVWCLLVDEITYSPKCFKYLYLSVHFNSPSISYCVEFHRISPNFACSELRRSYSMFPWSSRIPLKRNVQSIDWDNVEEQLWERRTQALHDRNGKSFTSVCYAKLRRIVSETRNK